MKENWAKFAAGTVLNHMAEGARAGLTKFGILNRLHCNRLDPEKARQKRILKNLRLTFIIYEPDPVNQNNPTGIFTLKNPYPMGTPNGSFLAFRSRNPKEIASNEIPQKL